MMKTETVLWLIGRFLRKLFIVNLIIFAGSAVFNYVLGWRTWWDYGSTLMWVGIIIVVFFGLGAFGATSLRSQDMKDFSITGTKNMDQQVQHQRNLEESRIVQTIQYLLIAAVPIIVGTILQSL
jgi:hypothetical protein